MNAKKNFMSWLKVKMPDLYKATLRHTPPPPNFLGSTDQKEQSWLDKAVSVVQQIAPAVVQYKQQKEILDVQLQRMKQGLPPLDTAQYAPTVTIQHQASPETVQQISSGVGEGLKKYALPLGGLLLALLFSRRKK